MEKLKRMTEKNFINKFIYPNMGSEEKISFLEGSSYPDEDYILELAKENHLSIY
jgi:hypothetical protein